MPISTVLDTLVGLPRAQLLFLLALAFLLLLVVFAPLPRRTKRRRRWRVQASERVLDRLAALEGFPQKIGYLRRLDPFLFEETILTALQRSGHSIERNSRYTGDGGVDGQVWLAGRRHLIQAKRYRRHINKSHLQAFDALCREHKCRGLFVHTGRTGKGVGASQTELVTIISGQRLLSLLEGNLTTPPSTVQAHAARTMG